MQFPKEEAKTQNKNKMLLPISPEEKKSFFDLESGVKMNVWLIVSRRLLRSEDQVPKFSAFAREAKEQETRKEDWPKVSLSSHFLQIHPETMKIWYRKKDGHQDHFNCLAQKELKF